MMLAENACLLFVLVVCLPSVCLGGDISPEQTTTLSIPESSTDLQTEIVVTWPNMWDLDIGYEEECRAQMYMYITQQNAPYSFLDLMCRCYFKICPPGLTEEQLAMKAKISKGLQQNRIKTYVVQYATAGAALGLTGVVGVVGNILVLVTIAVHLPRHNVTYIFITSLAIADLFVVTVCVPMQTMNYIYQEWIGGKVLCYIVNYLYFACFMCSIFSMTAMALERYFAICHPMKAQYMSTPGRARKIVVGIWVLSFLTGIPSAFVTAHSETRCSTDLAAGQALWFSIYLISAIFLIPSVLMGFAYVRICVILWKSIAVTKEMQAKSTHDGEPGKPKPKTTDSERKQVIKMLLVVLLIFEVCWAPVLLYYLLLPTVIHPYNLLTGYQAMIIKLTITVLSYVNSCLNPICYAFLSKQFQVGFKKFFAVCGVTQKKDVTSLATKSTAVSHSATSGSN